MHANRIDFGLLHLCMCKKSIENKSDGDVKNGTIRLLQLSDCFQLSDCYSHVNGLGIVGKLHIYVHSRRTL